MRDLFCDAVNCLKVENLQIRSNGKALLDVSSLVLDGPGPTLILGPNGAGKSLLLRCLHGLITPDRGQVVGWKTAGRGTESPPGDGVSETGSAASISCGQS